MSKKDDEIRKLSAQVAQLAAEVAALRSELAAARRPTVDGSWRPDRWTINRHMHPKAARQAAESVYSAITEVARKRGDNGDGDWKVKP